MKKFGFILSFVIVFTSYQSVFAKELQTSGRTSDSAAIINGSAGSVSNYPWMVFLADEFGEQYCGASLISPTWILTAAHCFLNDDSTAVDIETGANSNVILGSDTVSPLGANAITGAIGQIIVHPSYQPDRETSPNSDDYDIALVELTAAVDLTPVQLLASGSAVAAGTEAKIMGWGATLVNAENESTDPANSLLEALQQIVSTEDCVTAYGASITGNMICAGGLDTNDTTDTCQGDSGGPLVVAQNGTYVQVGIVSFGGTDTGPACGDAAAPGVYASVAALASFIAEHATDATFVTLGTTTPAITLAVEVSGTQLSISWSEYAGATGYIFYYAPYPDPTPISTLDVGSLRAISGELPVGSAFYVAVQPYNAEGAIDVFSNVANFTITGE